jgi:hypothetical protein
LQVELPPPQHLSLQLLEMRLKYQNEGRRVHVEIALTKWSFTLCLNTALEEVITRMSKPADCCKFTVVTPEEESLISCVVALIVDGFCVEIKFFLLIKYFGVALPLRNIYLQPTKFIPRRNLIKIYGKLIEPRERRIEDLTSTEHQTFIDNQRSFSKKIYL